MKAIILAAGRGSRMGNMTEAQPKCFVQVQGKRLLDWQLAALRASGIDDIAIVRGYRAECFTEPVHYFDNPRWAETNMVGSLFCADAWLSTETCIVSYADLFYTTASLAPLIAATADLAITYDPDWLQLWQKRFDDPLSDAETFRLRADGSLYEIGQKPKSLDEVQGQYMGLLKFTPASWARIKTTLSANQMNIDKLDMTSMLNHLLQNGIAVQAVPVHDRWGEIDSQADLASTGG